MHTSKAKSRSRQRARTWPGDAGHPRSVPCTFTCTACEAIEHRPMPVLPDGWAIEEIRGDYYAYCPECAVDLPGGARPQGSRR
ncbi:hypothetical protein SAMN05518801_10769 [Novosphingobium sp. CF614]|nr:hypothetical protein SAMN05518801_10769 [Novosphingobium sp. CF614]